MIFEVTYCENGIVKKEKMSREKYEEKLNNPNIEIIGTPKLTIAWAD